MPHRRNIPLPKKFGGNTPGLLAPTDWNQLRATLENILEELASLSPRPSPDIGIRHTTGGWTAHLKRHPGKAGGGAIPPLWITLRSVAGSPVTWEVYAQFGHVVPRHNASTDTEAPIEITSLPTKDAPLAVVENDKLWVKLTIDVKGKCTAAAFESGTSWPTDTPPVLVGGDLAGTAGTRYIRIAEIKAKPGSTATPPPLIREQKHTGHIDYSQPELIENCGAPLSGDEAGTLKEWNATEGRWEMRSIVVEGALGMSVVGCNIIITDCCS